MVGSRGGLARAVIEAAGGLPGGVRQPLTKSAVAGSIVVVPANGSFFVRFTVVGQSAESKCYWSRLPAFLTTFHAVELAQAKTAADAEKAVAAKEAMAASRSKKQDERLQHKRQAEGADRRPAKVAAIAGSGVEVVQAAEDGAAEREEREVIVREGDRIVAAD